MNSPVDKAVKEATPYVRLSKRPVPPKRVMVAVRIGSIILALIIGSIAIMLTGVNPFKAYAVIVEGALGNAIYTQQTIKIAVPLLGCALAIAPCFAMRFWNIGAEGQITMGAIWASFIAINFGASLPKGVLLILMLILSALGGAVWAFIPGYFKAKYNTNETLFTLMMNYIAIGIVAWLQGGPWEGRPGTQMIPTFHQNTWLPLVGGVHAGWIAVLIIAVFMSVYMNKTKHGFEVNVIGDSINTARYAGMNVGWVMIRTMILSGAISGIVGFLIVSGANHTLTKNIAAGNGFTAITVSWLSQLNPFVMILISMLLAIITKGSSTLNKRLGVPASVAEIVSGVLLFCMLSCEFFISYECKFREGTFMNAAQQWFKKVLTPVDHFNARVGEKVTAWSAELSTKMKQITNKNQNGGN